MIVIVIEHREPIPCYKCLEPAIDCTVMHVASSWEKAEQWVKGHTGIDDHSKDWFFWVGEEHIDGDIAIDHKERIYNKFGELVASQGEAMDSDDR